MVGLDTNVLVRFLIRDDEDRRGSKSAQFAGNFGH